MNSTDVTVSQHNLYCVIRRQEYFCFGPIKHMSIGLKLVATFIITAKMFRRPWKVLATDHVLAVLQYEQYRQWLFEAVARGYVGDSAYCHVLLWPAPCVEPVRGNVLVAEGGVGGLSPALCQRSIEWFRSTRSVSQRNCSDSVLSNDV